MVIVYINGMSALHGFEQKYEDFKFQIVKCAKSHMHGCIFF